MFIRPSDNEEASPSMHSNLYFDGAGTQVKADTNDLILRMRSCLQVRNEVPADKLKHFVGTDEQWQRR